MTEQLANLAVTTLAAPIGAPSAGTSEVIEVNSVTRFPTEPVFRLNLGGGELGKVTAVAGAKWTVERGAEETTPVAHPMGQIVVGVLTKDALDVWLAKGEPGGTGTLDSEGHQPVGQLASAVVWSTGAPISNVPVADGKGGYAWHEQSGAQGPAGPEGQVAKALLWGIDPNELGLTIVARFDANAITGATDGEALAEWLDASGNGHTAKQVAASKRPVYYKTTANKLINGLPAVWFANKVGETVVKQSMATAAFGVELKQPSTIFAVGRYNGLTGAEMPIYDGIVTGSRQAMYANPAGAFFETFAGTQQQGSAYDEAVHVFATVFNGASSSFYVDGTTFAVNPGANALTGLTLGANFNGGYTMDGAICEIIVFKGALTVTQASEVHNYLTTKWKTAITPSSISTPTTVRAAYGTPYIPLAAFGGKPALAFDNQPAFVAALENLIARGLMRSPEGGLATDSGCEMTSGSATVKDAAIKSTDVGAYVVGPGVPALTTITTVTAGVSFVMSQEATATATAPLGIGYPRGVIEIDEGRYQVYSPSPNFGPWVKLQGVSDAATMINFLGSGAAVTWTGDAIFSRTGTTCFDGLTIEGFHAAASGRVDTGCETAKGSTTVKDTHCIAADVGQPVFGLGISDGTTIATVNEGVSFTLSYMAPFDVTGELQIGGVRNVGALIEQSEGGRIGPDTCITGFGRPGSAGLFLRAKTSPLLTWNEKFEIPRLVLYGNNVQCHCRVGSLGYNNWNFIMFGKAATRDGLLLDGAQFNFGRLQIRGNWYVEPGQVSRILSVVGTNSTTGAGHINMSELDIAVEVSGGEGLTQTINLGPAATGAQAEAGEGNCILASYGRLKFGYIGETFVACNQAPKAKKLEFIGLIFGDDTIAATSKTYPVWKATWP